MLPANALSVKLTWEPPLLYGGQRVPPRAASATDEAKEWGEVSVAD